MLGDIPVIKPLFKWKRKSREEYELLFVITPHVKENRGIYGERRAFDLPSLDSRQEIPLGDEATPTKATPEGIPVNWLKMDEPLPPGARGPVAPSWSQPAPGSIKSPKGAGYLEAPAEPSGVKIEEFKAPNVEVGELDSSERNGLLKRIFSRRSKDSEPVQEEPAAPASPQSRKRWKSLEEIYEAPDEVTFEPQPPVLSPAKPKKKKLTLRTRRRFSNR